MIKTLCSMKRFTIFLLVATIYFSACNNKLQEDKQVQTDPVKDKINALVDDITSEFVPDKRVNIFEIDKIANDKGKYIFTGRTSVLKAKEKLISELKNQKIEFIDSISLLPHKNLEGKIYGVINLSVANMRSKPGHAQELGTQALMGTPIRIYEEFEDWYRIQTPDDYIAWTDPTAIRMMTKSEFNEWISAKKVIYTEYWGFSYSEPDENSQTVCDMVAGSVVKYVGDAKDGFIEIELPNTLKAFVKKKECNDFENWAKEANPTAEKIIATAKTMMGIPYLWGGTSTKSVDCSGFTKTSYFLNGIILERDASQQTYTGELIDTKNGYDLLQPGDLVFFGRKATANKKERVTHVGIYIGDSEFIHSSGKVKINSFNPDRENYSEYRTRTLIRGRRILNSINTEGIYKVLDNEYYKTIK